MHKTIIKTKLPLVLLLFFMVTGFRRSSDLTPQQKEQASEIVLKYTDLFQSFSNAGDMNDGDRQMIKLIELYQGSTYRHYNDLYSGVNLPEDPEIMHYLLFIADQYRYRLETKFNVISDVIGEEKNGILYATCTLEKTMNYNGKVKKSLNTLIINMDNKPYPKINLIEVPNKLPPPPPPPSQISVDSIIRTADTFIGKNDFIKARESLIKINEPKSSIDTQVAQRIQLCENEINFAYYKEQGDIYYNKGQFYTRAEELYSRALSFKPEDIYILEQIRNCKINFARMERSPEAISKKLKQSEDFWNNRKYYEAFSILYKYEDSGQLLPGHYFMLGEILIMNWDGIRQKMNFNKEQCLAKGANYMRQAALGNWKGNNIALKRYCDLRSSTIKALKLSKLDCAILDKEKD